MDGLKLIMKKIFLFRITSPASGATNFLSKVHPLNAALCKGFFTKEQGLLDISLVNNISIPLNIIM
jgi:hypothetical protein